MQRLLSLKLGTGTALLPLYPVGQSKSQVQPDSRAEKGDSLFVAENQIHIAKSMVTKRSLGFWPFFLSSITSNVLFLEY